ncbi:MAG: hypothetical protein WC647_17980 [Desulfomonilaceae bacterium]
MLDIAALRKEPVTAAELEELIQELLTHGRLFQLDDEGIARSFVDHFFDGNAWKLSLGQLRQVIAKLYGCSEDIPSDPDQVPNWVRKELFGFEYLPRDKLAEIYSWASEDLSAIEANIADCDRAIKKVERRSPKTDEDPSDIRFYRYYLQLNKEAKDEIIDVLTNKNKLWRKALSASYRPYSMIAGLTMQTPWSFRWYPERFHPSNFSSVRHAFGRLPLRIFREFERLYEAQDKTAQNKIQFYQRVEEFIAHFKPTEDIRRLLDEHHLLADRKRILLPALEAYEREEFELFISATATQIEGIITDGCFLSGISLEKLRLGSIIEKLEVLVRDTAVHIDYVYYAFKFPVLRNRIAHGHMLRDDVRHTAHLLLLDLYDCCRIVREHPGAPNSLVEFLRRVKSDMATVADLVEFAAIYVETDGEPPNDFYELDQEFEKFRLLLDRQAFWNFLHKLLDPKHEVIDIGLRFITDQLNHETPALGIRCKSLMKGMGQRGVGKFDRDDFMSAVRRQQGHDCLVKNMEEIR